MNRCHKIPLFCICISLLFCCRARCAEDAARDTTLLVLTLPQILTTDLSSEINPSLSPDGRWLLYSSSRNGNYDIWIRPAGGGVPTALTTHPADDYDPVWSPKGDRISFVSTRDDPEGDIFEMKVALGGLTPRTSTPKALVSDLGAQSSPSYSKNGKYIIYQEDRSNRARIILLKKSNKSKRELTTAGYVHPQFSLVNDQILCIQVGDEGYGGDICRLDIGSFKSINVKIDTVYSGSFPAAAICWSPSGSSFVAALVNRDSNHDGLLTLNDAQALFRFDLVDTSYYTFRPISIGDASESYPFWAKNGFLYYSGDRRGNPDLWRLPANGPIPQAGTAQAAMNFAQSVGWESEITGIPLSEQEFLAKLLAYEKVRLDFPLETNLGARSMLESARLLMQRGLPDRAESYLKRIPRQYPHEQLICAEAEIDYQSKVHKVVLTEDGNFRCENPSSLITNLRNIISAFPEADLSVARCYYLIGAALEQLGNIEAALQSYNKVEEDFSDADDYPALALLRIGGLYARIGSGDEALQTYLYEIDSYSQRVHPTQQAIERVIAMGVSGDEPIAGLQDLIGKYSLYPALTAAAQERIADILALENESELALGEYDRLHGFALRKPIPYVRTRLAEGLISAARVENQCGDYLHAQELLQEVQQNFSDLQNGFFAGKARHLRISMLADRAEQVTSQGDFDLARSIFELALSLDPQNVRLYRGRITAAYGQKKIDDLTNEYQKQVLIRPDDATALYASGLCLSYQGEHSKASLQQSNQYLQSSLAYQPELAYGYLTLGYNYEQLENLAKQQGKGKKSFFRSAYRGTLTVLSNLGRLLTLRKLPRPIQGYELAIETLQLGLAVNDEANNPQLEAQMLLNLGNNYYRLGEFGYPRSLAAYQQRMKLDSTFTSKAHEAVIRERMGEAAAITGKNDIAIDNFQRSLKLYHDTRHPEDELRTLLRLAEIYQVLKQEELSNEYYSKAIALSDREGLSTSPTRWYGNVAFNSLEMGDSPSALDMAQKAITSLPPIDQLPDDKVNNPLILEFLGVPVPILNFGYLGTGSPSSAYGFGKKDELLLNYSIAQDVYTQQKDLDNSKDKAGKRLAINFQRQDLEAQAIQWSELGFLNWASGDLVAAHRCFLRSFFICAANGYRTGKLAALTNIACITLSGHIPEKTSTDVYLEESEWLCRYKIGLPNSQWERVVAVARNLNSGRSALEVKKDLRTALQIIPDEQKDNPPPLDWRTISDLLLLQEDPFADTKAVLNAIKSEVDNFQRDHIGFSAERIRFYELYAQLNLQLAADIRSNDIRRQFEKLQLEGEAFWSYQNGIKEAQKRKDSEQEVVLRLELSDLLFNIRDYVGSAAELIYSQDRIESIGYDHLRWRLYLRAGRLAMVMEDSAASSPPAIFRRILNRKSEEWFDLALRLWENLPISPDNLGGASQSKIEVKVLIQTSALSGIKHRNNNQALIQAQNLANLPLMDAIASREIGVQFEKRKYYWSRGGGVIPYMRRELQDYKQKIAQLRGVDKPDSASIAQARADLSKRDGEYQITLATIKQDDPEFASLFSLTPFTADTIQSSLEPSDLYLQILNLADNPYLLKMTTDTISILPIQTSRDKIDSLFTRFQKLLEADSTEENLAEKCYDAIFSSVKGEIDTANRLFLVVPAEWSGIPFELFKSAGKSLNQTLTVNRLPDAQSLVYLRSKLSVGRGDLICFAEHSVPTGFIGAKFQSAVDVRSAIENAEVTLIEPQRLRGVHPLDRVILKIGEKSWTLKNLFEVNTRGEILFIEGSFPDEALMARVAFFAGFSNVIFIPEGMNPSQLNQFMTIFRQSQISDAPARALMVAMDNLRVDGSSLRLLSGFRYYGNGGMNKRERENFARRSFKATVLKGNFNLEHGDGEWALRYYDQALAMAEEISDNTSILRLHQLRIQAAKIIPRWDEAARSQEFLLRSAQKLHNRDETLNGLRNLSVYLTNLDSLDSAISLRLQARNICIEGGDDLDAATDDRALAVLFEKKEDYSSAIASLTFAQITSYTWSEYSDYIKAGIYISRLLMVQEKFTDAQKELLILESYAQKAASESGKPIFLPAEYYQHLGLALAGITDYRGAIDAQKHALAVLTDSVSSVSALSHQYLASLYWKLGDYQQGLSELQTAKNQFSALDVNQYIYLCENIEALIYLSLGDKNRALENAKTALEGAVACGDSKTRSQIEKNIGLIELARGEINNAKSRFFKALEIDQQIPSLSGQGNAYQDLGNAYLQLHQLDSAKVVLEKALVLGDSISDDFIKARSYLGLGLMQLEQNAMSPALQNLLSADSLAKKRELKELLWRIDLALGKVAMALGRDDDAMSMFERAMNRVEIMQASIAADALKSGFMEDKQEIYRTAVELLLKQAKNVDALTIVERSKSRVFLDMLQNNPMDHRAGLDPQLQRQEEDLTEKLSRIEATQFALKNKGSERTPGDDLLISQDAIQIDSLKQAYSRLLETIESRHPGYKDLVSVNPDSTVKIQALLAADEALVEYYALTKSVAIFVIRAAEIKIELIPVSIDSIGMLVDRLRNRLNKKLTVTENDQLLFNLLFSPIEKYLVGCAQITFIPTGSLHYLPFSILQNSDEKYLLDLYTLSCAPSAGVFAFCRERARNRPDLGERTIYAYSNPASGKSQENLFFAQKEVASLAFTFTKTITRFDSQATESVLIQDAADAGALHLSCHGQFDAAYPLFSSLSLVGDRSEDGQLHTYEIFDLNLENCALVTLSACESGLGGISSGDEIVGMNRAFIYAGAPRILSTLWKVDDLATAILMKHFYRKLQQGMTPAAALRAAQIHVRERLTPHPGYWAAFELTGEPFKAANLALKKLKIFIPVDYGRKP